MFVKTKRGEQVGRDLFIDGLHSRTIRAKLRKQFSPINHTGTLQQIIAAAEEMERKFAANFLEGEDYPKEGDSSELARARAELAALQNKFDNMGFVSGAVTYLEQIAPKRPAPSVITSVLVPVIPAPVMTAPPPPIENPWQFSHVARSRPVAMGNEVPSPSTPVLLSRITRCPPPRSPTVEELGRTLRRAVGGLVEVKVTWTRHRDHRQWAEYLELLIIQAWQTGVEGDLLGFLFGLVRPDHRQLIVHELTVPLAQLADDLPLEIVSQIDDSPVPHVLTRTISPYLQWLACLEEPESGRNPLSRRDYLEPHEIVDLVFFRNQTASENEEVEIEAEEESSKEEEVEKETDEEETPEEGSYSEHSGGEQSEDEEEEEQSDDEEEEDQEELEESEWEAFEEEWVRCPMGICNAPATFQRATNMTFQNFVNKTRLTQGMINFCVIVYMDDILVYSETYHGHAQHIELTLGAMRDARFKIALEKSGLFLSEISFLGYVVTRGGLWPDSRKVAAVREAPVPTSLTQVRAFLGLASYYRRFIKGFAAIARPLTNQLRKDQPLSWDAELRPDHRQLIVHELTVALAQLADDLPLEIVSQSDDNPVPHVLTRTLAPYLQWSVCLEEPGSGRNPPSRRGYLDPYEIVDLAFFQDRTASENEEVEIEAEEEGSKEEEEAEGEADEEETPEEGSYSEHSEGEQSEEEGKEEQGNEEEEDQDELEESEWEGFEEEVRDEARARARAQKKKEIAARKR
ncbi:hypothetical protein CBR_g38848 [Chara braunii]|uniref:Reverse transcriptase domain-containing protein n=1 Tax=Chara braunii TaxID=69332 RepID=A0A388LQF9_CHABU|nr:hypothetical protein CBR_g38848 [Chara braunii]|eukprot:GBG84566.1 hypothetical protein CBR_g38848 [Chara braunii]